METTITQLTDTQLQDICNTIDKAYYTNDVRAVSYITLDRQQVRTVAFYGDNKLQMAMFLGGGGHTLESRYLNEEKEKLPEFEDRIFKQITKYCIELKFMTSKGYTNPDEFTAEDKEELINLINIIK